MNANKKKVILICSAVYYKGDGYKTRVIAELERLSKEFDTYLFLPEFAVRDPDQRWKNMTITYKSYYNMRLHRVRNWISFNKKLKEVLSEDNYIVIAESLIPAFKSARIAKNTNSPFVFDCHGEEPEEYKMMHSDVLGRLISFVLKCIERYVITMSDLLVTVSKNQFKLWHINKPHVIFPMIPSDHFMDNGNSRQLVRNELGIGDEDEVYVYSGQNQVWQMSDETMDVFKAIEKSKPNSRLVIFTGAVDYFANLCKQKEIANVIIKTINYFDMPMYLDACDFGFCLRANSIVNIVASPTKVLEYLSRNIKPIITPYVGDFSNELPQLELAVEWNGETSFSKDLNFDGKNYVNHLKETTEKEYVCALKNL